MSQNPSTGPNDTDSADGDAVCFSAGLAGAIFGTGVIHAYLASDREPPKVTAGISVGALCAAAMRQCYQQLQMTDEAMDPAVVEAHRWRWFRKFLRVMTDRPLSVCWRGLPNRSDFFAGFRTQEDPATPDTLKKADRRAAERRDILTTLVRWIARLPISVNEFARLTFAYIAVKEKRGRWAKLKLLAYLFWTAERFSIFVFLQPLLGVGIGKERYRLLFGWRAWLLSCLLVLPTLLMAFPLAGQCLLPLTLPFHWWQPTFVLLAATGLYLVGFRLRLLVVLGLVCFLLFLVDPPMPALQGLLILFAVWLAPRVCLLIRKVRHAVFRLVSEQAIKRLRLNDGLIDGFHLDRELAELFVDPVKASATRPADREPPTDGGKPTVGDPPFPVVIVAAPLQPLSKASSPSPGTPRGLLRERTSYKQLFARPHTSLVEALGIAMRRVQLMGSNELGPGDVSQWLGSDDEPEPSGPASRLNLVAGSLTRRNPLPALFQYLRNHREKSKSLTGSEEWGKRAIHVIYEVPLEDRSPEARAADIVDLGILGLRLKARRDTQLEVKQTNYISKLEHAFRELRGKDLDELEERPLLQLFADEISPQAGKQINELVNPETGDLLEYVAHGCRRTLETLYRSRIADIHDEGESATGSDEEADVTEFHDEGGPTAGSDENTVPCEALLGRVAPRRAENRAFKTPGLPEVCQACTARLEVQKSRRKPPVPPLPLEDHPNLTGEKPRIVLVASGGVFRGAFHIGLLAALRKMAVQPDLIAGASVGTLIGGAMATLLKLDATAAAQVGNRLLGALVDCFVEVDKTIAFTRRFRYACQELATRALTIDLSPSDVRRLVLSGSRRDPGFAATGAPPALIDAIATLFLLPHKDTAEIAARTLAGQYGSAAALWGEKVKENSLRRLGIESAIVGRSLLEKFTHEILSVETDDGVPVLDLSRRQPFRTADGKLNIAFLATATNLATKELCNLGTEEILPGAPFDFLKAALASSAFPTIFEPVRESDIFPGVGNSDVLYSDGGMFDNLPFVPAVEVLVELQRAYRRQCRNSDALELLRRRYEQPDLFLVGSLGVQAGTEKPWSASEGRPYPHFDGAFQEQVKIQSFESVSYRMDRQIGELLRQAKDDEVAEAWLEDHQETLDGAVPAAVLPIYPADKEHLNGTFAFCATLRLEKKRMHKSIAHGCFQTLLNLARLKHNHHIWDISEKEEGDDLMARSFAGLRKNHRLPLVKPAKPGEAVTGWPETEHPCPHFLATAAKKDEIKAFTCPFTEAVRANDKEAVRAEDREKSPNYGPEVFTACCHDETHKKMVADEVKIQKDASDN